jgi:hypothetical protein
VGVRAVSAAGLSPDRGSDGVIVRMPQGSGGGGGNGGGGGSGGGGGGSEGGGGASSGRGGGGGDGGRGGAGGFDETLLYGRGCACSGAPAQRGVPRAAGPSALALALALFARSRGRRGVRRARSGGVKTPPAAG